MKRSADTDTSVHMLPIFQLTPNPWNRTQFDSQALKELTKSIRAEGIREPLLVRQKVGTPEKRLANAAEKGSPIKETTLRLTGQPPHRPAAVQPVYEIASGNRRWLAAQAAGLTKVPCLIEALSDEQVAEDNITMNIQREDIPPLELARMVQDYMTRFGKSQAEAARVFGKSRAWASQLLGFIKMPAKARKVFTAVNMGWHDLRLIRSLPPDLTVKLAQEAEDEKLSVRGVARRCRQLLFGSNSKGGIAPDPQVPDPLQKEWPRVNDAMLSASGLWWDVRYAKQNLPGGKKELGWHFFVLPQDDLSKEALAEWFTQMGAALRGKKMKSMEERLVQQTQSIEGSLMNVFEPRLPRTAAEEKELHDIAVRGTLRDVYTWIYGKDSPVTLTAPMNTWKEIGTTPEQAVRDILAELQGLSRGKK